MKMTHWIVLGLTFFGAACARVQVEAPKEPIKMDISMRLDVYQHMVDKADAVENIVRGKNETQSAWIEFFVTTAYAEEDLSPALRDAALRRRARFEKIEELQKSGVLGEGRDGYIALRDSSRKELKNFINEENKDRKITFTEVAKSDNAPFEKAQQIFAIKFRGKAPIGSPVQDDDGTWRTQ